MTGDRKLLLYSFPLSANGYRAGLLLDYLAVPHETLTVDLSSGEQRSPDFLKINPLGQLPVLIDGDLTLWDSHAIIAYVADRHRSPAAESIWPSAAAERAQIAKWMYFDAVELHFGIGLARNHHTFGMTIDVASAEQRALKALDVLERRLKTSVWLEFGRLTMADLCCYPLVSVADEARIDLSRYPAVEKWVLRIEQLTIPPRPSLATYRKSRQADAR